jgi:hypothetical protein
LFKRCAESFGLGAQELALGERSVQPQAELVDTIRFDGRGHGIHS